MTDGPGPERPVAAVAAELIKAGRFEEASLHLERHLAGNPGDQVARSLLGLAAFDSGDYVRAEAVYRTMVSPRPDPRALYSLGVALERHMRRDEAAHWFGAAVAADPSFTVARKALDRLAETTHHAGLSRPGNLPFAAADVRGQGRAAGERTMHQGPARSAVVAVLAAAVAVAAGSRFPARALFRALLVGGLVGLVAGAVDQGARELEHFDLGLYSGFIVLGTALGMSGATGARGWKSAAGGMVGGGLVALLASEHIVSGRFSLQLLAAVLIVGGTRAAELIQLDIAPPGADADRVGSTLAARPEQPEPKAGAGLEKLRQWRSRAARKSTTTPG